MDDLDTALTQQKAKIMIVDDSIANLTIARKALEPYYQVIPVPSGKKAIELVSKVMPALVLLDVDMPEVDGFETLRMLKSLPETEEIPVIFLTAKDDSGSELEGLRLGAVDYIAKPFSIPLLLQRIMLHIELVNQKKELKNYNINLTSMVQEKTEIISELQHAIIHTLIDLIEYRDGLTGGHVTRTEKYLELLVAGLEDMNYYQDEMKQIDLDTLYESAQLHDIGKIAVSDTLLKKPGKLTPEEFEQIKIHTVIGEQAIRRAMQMTRDKEFLECAAVVAISHHEKWDGSGYPYGLKGAEIPFAGRLMAMADVYDALVSERPYKKAFSHKTATDIILSESGKHFDPILVEVFFHIEDKFAQILKEID